VFFNKIRNEFNLTQDEIRFLCTANDTYGNSRTIEFTPGFFASPTTMRYIYHACKIFSIHKEKYPINFVEVGGGYGGLALIMHLLAEKYNITIKEYRIYDIPEVQALQKAYINASDVKNANITFGNCSEFASDMYIYTHNDVNWFLISAYAIGEFGIPMADKYLSNLCGSWLCGGFLVWNTEELSNNIPSIAVMEIENPDTSCGRNNRVISWYKST
jgi:hypothetical protein